MKFKIKNNNGGFTIIEAIIAVFILSISITAMLGLTISSYSSARYANNELTANYLLQEAVDAIRNSRDTMVFQKAGDKNANWSAFLTAYGKDTTSSCFSTNGCGVSINSYFSPATPSSFLSACDANVSGEGSTIPCPALGFDDSAQGGSYYSGSGTSRFKRQVKMASTSNPNEVEVTATVEYPNGTTFKTRILKMNLLNWQN